MAERLRRERKLCFSPSPLRRKSELADSFAGDIEELEAHAEEIQREGRNKTTYLNARLGKGGHPWEA